MDSYTSPTTKPLFRGVQVVWYFLTIIEVILLFRFVFRLTGANPSAGFTAFIYSLARPFILPFQAVFPSQTIEGSVFEWTTLLAMFVYYLVAIGIIQLFAMSRSVSTPEAAAKLEEHDEL